MREGLQAMRAFDPRLWKTIASAAKKEKTVREPCDELLGRNSELNSATTDQPACTFHEPVIPAPFDILLMTRFLDLPPADDVT